MIFRRQQPQTFPFSSIFVADNIVSDGIVRSDPNGGESVAPLYVYDDKSSQNMGVAFERSVTEDVFVTDAMPEHAMLGTAGFAGQFAPLFVMDDGRGHRANFNFEKFKDLFSDVEQPDEKTRQVYPEDVFDYIYASLHDPSYRKKYKEFLKTDFPRVPRPKNWFQFWCLVESGRALRELHLMKNVEPGNYPFMGEGNGVVDKLRYEDGNVYINAVQYFANVPAATWNFYIGGYQPAQKWLKDRKGRPLSYKDIEHYQRIIKILLETDRIMEEIDSINA